MMKKILLGTTAIVGLGLIAGPVMAAEAPELEIGGFAKFEMDFLDEDSEQANGNRGYRFEVDDFEIVFKAKAVADNGLEYGAKLEMQFANGDAGADFTDEAMIWLSGNWGLVNLGNEDGAESLMAVAGYSVIGGAGAWDGENFFTRTPSSGYVSSSMVGDTGDATKITYFTPSFSGFRVGASWTPDTAHFGGEALNDDDGTQENTFEIGAEYKGSFNDVGVHGSVRYIAGDYESNDIGTTAERNEVSSWGVGAQVTYAGFALAGSYNDGGDSGITKSAEAIGAEAATWWDIALSYSTGPYSVGVGYYSAEETDAVGTTAVDRETEIFAITGGWNVAPGLDFYAEYDYVELDDGLAATATDNEANVFIVGTKVSF